MQGTFGVPPPSIGYRQFPSWPHQATSGTFNHFNVGGAMDSRYPEQTGPQPQVVFYQPGSLDPNHSSLYGGMMGVHHQRMGFQVQYARFVSGGNLPTRCPSMEIADNLTNS